MIPSEEMKGLELTLSHLLIRTLETLLRKTNGSLRVNMKIEVAKVTSLKKADNLSKTSLLLKKLQRKLWILLKILMRNSMKDTKLSRKRLLIP